MTDREVWLIGFSIDPDKKTPDVYTIFLSGDVDEPLVFEEYVIFFSKIELVTKALSICSNNVESLRIFPKEVDLVCDIAQTLYLINYEDVDTSATIIDFLNILFDLVKAIKLPMPIAYRKMLYSFADHLTFSREISTFCAEQKISRVEITNAITWCIGAVVSKSKLIT